MLKILSTSRFSFGKTRVASVSGLNRLISGISMSSSFSPIDSLLIKCRVFRHLEADSLTLSMKFFHMTNCAFSPKSPAPLGSMHLSVATALVTKTSAPTSIFLVENKPLPLISDLLISTEPTNSPKSGHFPEKPFKIQSETSKFPVLET
uniref:Uncharacterized protein n=1 Tax=Opuntia streptacantha TaxID=393608 RepID=A0A7C9CFZ6_OPUST